MFFVVRRNHKREFLSSGGHRNRRTVRKNRRASSVSAAKQQQLQLHLGRRFVRNCKGKKSAESIPSSFARDEIEQGDSDSWKSQRVSLLNKKSGRSRSLNKKRKKKCRRNGKKCHHSTGESPPSSSPTSVNKPRFTDVKRT